MYKILLLATSVLASIYNLSGQYINNDVYLNNTRYSVMLKIKRITYQTYDGVFYLKNLDSANTAPLELPLKFPIYNPDNKTLTTSLDDLNPKSNDYIFIHCSIVPDDDSLNCNWTSATDSIILNLKKNE